MQLLTIGNDNDFVVMPIVNLSVTCRNEQYFMYINHADSRYSVYEYAIIS